MIRRKLGEGTGRLTIHLRPFVLQPPILTQRRTSVARTPNHARGPGGRLPASRPVHALGCAVSAPPQCRREVSVGPLPRPGTPLGPLRRPPGLHARRLRATARPSPAPIHAAPTPGEPVDL